MRLRQRRGRARPRVSSRIQPQPQESELIIANTQPQRIGEMRIEKRGGTGTRRQASPDPRTTHNPRAEAEGVC
jgi:hypothetical protein